MRLVGVLVKTPSITSSEVSTQFRPVPKSRLGGLTFAEAPLSAISRSNWSPESAEVRPLFKAPREDGSLVPLWNWIAVKCSSTIQPQQKKENKKYDNSALKTFD